MEEPLRHRASPAPLLRGAASACGARWRPRGASLQPRTFGSPCSRAQRPPAPSTPCAKQASARRASAGQPARPEPARTKDAAPFDPSRRRVGRIPFASACATGALRRRPPTSGPPPITSTAGPPSSHRYPGWPGSGVGFPNSPRFMAARKGVGRVREGSAWPTGPQFLMLRAGRAIPRALGATTRRSQRSQRIVRQMTTEGEEQSKKSVVRRSCDFSAAPARPGCPRGAARVLEDAGWECCGAWRRRARIPVCLEPEAVRDQCVRCRGRVAVAAGRCPPPAPPGAPQRPDARIAVRVQPRCRARRRACL